MIEKFIGLWVDNNANLLLIEPWKLNILNSGIVKVLFALFNRDFSGLLGIMRAGFR
jgi:hypothetical protein